MPQNLLPRVAPSAFACALATVFLMSPFRTSNGRPKKRQRCAAMDAMDLRRSSPEENKKRNIRIAPRRTGEVDPVVEATDSRIKAEAVKQLDLLDLDDPHARVDPLWSLRDF